MRNAVRTNAVRERTHQYHWTSRLMVSRLTDVPRKRKARDGPWVRAPLNLFGTMRDPKNNPKATKRPISMAFESVPRDSRDPGSRESGVGKIRVKIYNSMINTVSANPTHQSSFSLRFTNGTGPT